MSISAKIDACPLEEVMALTGEQTASAKAVTEFVRRQKAREFGRLIRESAFDYPDPVPATDPVPALAQ